MNFKEWLTYNESGFYDSKYDYPYDSGEKYIHTNKWTKSPWWADRSEAPIFDKKSGKWLAKKNWDYEFKPKELNNAQRELRNLTHSLHSTHDPKEKAELFQQIHHLKSLIRELGYEEFTPDPKDIEEFDDDAYRDTPLDHDENPDHPRHDPDEPNYYSPDSDPYNPENWYDRGRNWKHPETMSGIDAVHKYLDTQDDDTIDPDEMEKAIPRLKLNRDLKGKGPYAHIPNVTNFGGGHWEGEPSNLGARAFERTKRIGSSSGIARGQEMPSGFHLAGEKTHTRQSIRDKYLDLLGKYYAKDFKNEKESDLLRKIGYYKKLLNK